MTEEMQKIGPNGDGKSAVATNTRHGRELSRRESWTNRYEATCDNVWSHGLGT